MSSTLTRTLITNNKVIDVPENAYFSVRQSMNSQKSLKKQTNFYHLTHFIKSKVHFKSFEFLISNENIAK
jgi:hypothetical protein